MFVRRLLVVCNLSQPFSFILKVDCMLMAATLLIVGAVGPSYPYRIYRDKSRTGGMGWLTVDVLDPCA